MKVLLINWSNSIRRTTVFYIKLMTIGIPSVNIRWCNYGINCPAYRSFIEIEIIIYVIIPQSKIGVKAITHFIGG